jgi:hypothetical protein
VTKYIIVAFLLLSSIVAEARINEKRNRFSDQELCIDIFDNIFLIVENKNNKIKIESVKGEVRELPIDSVFVRPLTEEEYIKYFFIFQKLLENK